MNQNRKKFDILDSTETTFFNPMKKLKGKLQAMRKYQPYIY